MKKNERFVVCINNRENPVSLQVRKLYRVIEPQKNDPPEYVRIIDETGEDYLFPTSWFVAVKLSATVADAVSHAQEAAPAT